MEIAIVAVGLLMIATVLFDAFETVVLPTQAPRSFRLTRLPLKALWRVWSSGTRLLIPQSRRKSYLTYFGPLSTILVLAIWATGLILGLALLQWGLGSQFKFAGIDDVITFGTYIYVSGSTFFTLGLGDVMPISSTGRILTVMEAGIGFAFLTIVISYLPALNQAFSRREVPLSMLFRRTGASPGALAVLAHYRKIEDLPALDSFLAASETWSAELLGSHLAYPILAYYRSPRESRSWLAALTTVLDLSTLLIVGLDGIPARQAPFTFEAARQCVVDIASALRVPPLTSPASDRLSPQALARLRAALAAAGMPLQNSAAAEELLFEMRKSYEPYLAALANLLLLPIPAWISSDDEADAASNLPTEL